MASRVAERSVGAEAADARRGGAAGNVGRGGWGIGAILALYLVLGLIYSVVTPVMEASDELWHYPLVRHLAHGGALPVQYPDQIGPWRQEGSQPPLYYALAALATAWIDTDDMDEVRRLNPHADMGVLTSDRNVNMIVHTPAERFPYRGTVLAIQVVRWLSVLMGAVTVYAGYRLAREVFPADERLALVAAALTAFNAMYLFITASVNNDALVVMLCALALWRMAHYLAALERPAGPTRGEWVLLGTLLGLAALSKASALGMLPLAALVGTAVAWRRRSWRVFLEAGLLIGVPVLAISGWWFLRNWRLYRDPLGLNAFVAVVGARHPVPSLRQLAGEWAGFVMSYWGLFGGVNVAAPGWVYVWLSGMGLLGLLGAPLYVYRAARQGYVTLVRGLQIVLVAIWPVVVFVSLIRWTLMTIASQGRLMFSALTALSLLMAMGLAALWPRRPYALPAVGAVSMLAIAALLPFQTIRPAYAPPRLLTEKDVQRLTPQVDVSFGDAIRLLSYSVDRTEALPGDELAVTLYWQCLQPLADDYSIFLHLVAEDEIIVAQRDVYPGQGTYATSLWSEGDIFADRLVMRIPEAAMTPAQARFAVGLYRLDSGMRLPVRAPGGEVRGDAYHFGGLDLPERVRDGIPNPVSFDLEGQVRLVGYRLDRRAAAPEESLDLTLFWQAQVDLEVNYSVFVQIVGEEHRLWAQVDAWPRQGEAPTATWRKGQIIEDPYTVTVAADAPPGLFPLQVGMYDGDLRRLSLLGSQGHVQDNRILLGNVRILASGGP